MKIVIDIDENLYTRLFDNGVDNYDDAVDMAKAIRKGTPLPEHHEDCISREAVKEMLTEEWTKYMPMESDVNLSFVLEKISELPSVTLKTSEKEHKIGVAYICDGEKCPKCLKPCKHTYDISHAKNFRPIMSIDRKTVIDYEEVDKNGRTEK